MKFNKKAFSVAEAMVTLLIVSIALAAAAPIMSRSVKNTIVNNNNNKWSFVGNGPSIFRSEGNVGIGTANPLEKLHVDGNTRITGTTTIANNNGSVTITNSALNNENDPAVFSISNDYGTAQITASGSAYLKRVIVKRPHTGFGNMWGFSKSTRLTHPDENNSPVNDTYTYWEHFNGTTAWNPNYNTVVMFDQNACPTEYATKTNLKWNQLGTITIKDTSGNDKDLILCKRESITFTKDNTITYGNN